MTAAFRPKVSESNGITAVTSYKVTYVALKYAYTQYTPLIQRSR